MDWQTESPELWAFLGTLRPGQILSGTVAAIERFGVFVALDDGPEHPVFPGVGFITVPELSWGHLEAMADVVHVGKRVFGEFLQFDTRNAEARLSLRAIRPDPFRAFASSTAVGQVLRATVTKPVSFGVFVRVADEIEGLVHLPDFASPPPDSPEGSLRAGDEVAVTVRHIDRVTRRLSLSLSSPPHGAPAGPPGEA